MQLYRITRNDPPTVDDMKSHWDLGKRPARLRDEAAWKEVSVFDSAERAAAKVRARDLGSSWPCLRFLTRPRCPMATRGTKD